MEKFTAFALVANVRGVIVKKFETTETPTDLSDAYAKGVNDMGAAAEEWTETMSLQDDDFLKLYDKMTPHVMAIRNKETK